MARISETSHADHGLTTGQWEFVKNHISGKTAFFLETVELPEELGTAPCGIYGPIMGDDPVPDEECSWVIRGNRRCASRVCNRPERPIGVLTLIGGYTNGEVVLWTAYGGYPAPKEPGDLSIRTWDDLVKSREFWAQHALTR